MCPSCYLKMKFQQPRGHPLIAITPWLSYGCNGLRFIWESFNSHGQTVLTLQRSEEKIMIFTILKENNVTSCGAKARAKPILQWFIPCKARIEIQKHLERLLDYEILLICQSFWNMSLLLVLKQSAADYWPVEHLWAVNKAIFTLHLVVLLYFWGSSLKQLSLHV